MDDIEKQEYELFCKKMDDVLKVMQENAKKKGRVFYGAFTVREEKGVFTPWYGHRHNGGITQIDRIALQEYMNKSIEWRNTME